jgi:hypothetical protein
MVNSPMEHHEPKKFQQMALPKKRPIPPDRQDPRKKRNVRLR